MEWLSLFGECVLSIHALRVVSADVYVFSQEEGRDYIREGEEEGDYIRRRHHIRETSKMMII